MDEKKLMDFINITVLKNIKLIDIKDLSFCGNISKGRKVYSGKYKCENQMMDVVVKLLSSTDKIELKLFAREVLALK